MSTKVFECNFNTVGLESLVRQENDKDLDNDEDSTIDEPLLEIGSE